MLNICHIDYGKYLKSSSSVSNANLNYSHYETDPDFADFYLVI